MPRRAPAGVLVVLVCVFALEIGYGAGVGHSALYAVYELGFVILPGWLAYRALSPFRGDALRQLVMGWALGYVLEVLFFMLTAATGTRDLFPVYPAAVALVALMVAARRGTGSSRDELPLPPGSIWLISGLCVAAVLYLGVTYFADSPLPGRTSVAYFIDYPRWISMAAEAVHHWPILDPSVSGEPLPYHYFVNVHIAAVSQVTHLGLPLVYFRLFVIPLVVLFSLELVVAGRSLVGSARVGVLSAALALFVGQLRLDTRQTLSAHTPFLGLFFTFVLRSPSFLFGLVIFVPIIILLGEYMSSRSPATGVAGWSLLTLYLVGASDAKITLLPLVFAALLLYAAGYALRRQRPPPAVWLGAGLTLLVFAVLYVVQYRGHSSRTGLHPFAMFDDMPAVSLLKHYLVGVLPSFPAKRTLLSAGGIAFGTFGLFAAQLVGIALLVRRRGRGLDERLRWLFAVLGSGVLLSYVLAEPATVSAVYFVSYGVVAGCLLSAEGFRRGWRARPALSHHRVRTVALSILGLCLLVALVVVPLHLFSGRHSEAHRYALWYGGLLVTLLALYALAQGRGGSRWLAVATVSVCLLLVGALDTPVDYIEPAVTSSSASSVALVKPLTPDLFRALTWVRRHTPANAVVAVNNQWFDRGNRVPLEFNYSAFSERRVFLEGWEYSQRSVEIGYEKIARGVNPFLGRLRLNEAAFAGDRAALRTLAGRYGVRYLFIDRLYGYPAAVGRLGGMTRRIYENPGAEILALNPF